jgi:hypothetical protein
MREGCGVTDRKDVRRSVRVTLLKMEAYIRLVHDLACWEDDMATHRAIGDVIGVARELSKVAQGLKEPLTEAETGKDTKGG